MFCPQCGTAHTPGGSYCGNCGIRLPFAARAAAGPGAPAADAQRPLFAGVMTSDQARRPSAPLFTLAVVVGVVGVGLAFGSLTAVIRGLADGDAHDAARAAAARPGSGAFATLLANDPRRDTAQPRPAK